MRSLLPAVALLLLVSGHATAQTYAGAPQAPRLPGAPERAALAGFGAALVVTADAVLAGEPYNQMRSGLVYVYRRQGGAWAEAAKLAAEGAEPGDGFGSAIAMDDETLLVGAAGEDGGRGAAYVFRRHGDAWRQVARLAVDGGAEGDALGAAVALQGDIALVAAPTAAGRAGAVHVFRRGGNGRWTHEARLASDESGERFYGAAVALSEGRAFIGAPGRAQGTGAVEVYERGADGAWTRTAVLAAAGLLRNDGFGSTLALAGNVLLVGAPGVDAGRGAVYAFAPDEAGEWRERGRLVAFDGARRDGFGAAIAADGDELWIGAPRARGSQGAVYRFERAPDGDVAGVRRLAAQALDRGDAFGSGVALRGNVAAIAMLGDDYGSGTVVIFERGADGAWREAAVVKSPAERLASIVGGETRCGDDGKAALFDCKDVDLLAFLSIQDLGGGRGVRLNDVWGWTDPETGKEYALVGRVDGTSFVDISDPTHPVFIGDLPKTAASPGSTWRDIKVYQDHAFIVADGAGPHGVQVFDLRRLRNVRQPPVTFKPDAHYTRINSAHNIVINEETGFAYSVGNSSGGEVCGGGLHMIDIRDPRNPTFAGCFSDPQTGRASTGYTHDAQCVVYRGPDEDYRGREICFGANETALSIADVTDKKNPKAISRATYPNVGYSHQGWLTPDHRYFYMDDELDEIQGSVQRTRTLIWDVEDLDDPQLAAEFLGTTAASDHNLYIRGDTMYQSHYQAGLRIVDISNRLEPVEVGYFDTVPYGTNTPGFGGSWSNYPFFRSGIIIVTSGNEGLFIVKPREKPPVSQ
jgi:choice-of-anchor B domain-containing protein